MGVPSSDFWSMCMYQFQSIRAAFCIQHGLHEDGSDPDQITIDEFRDLLDKVSKNEAKRNGIQT